MMIVACGSWHQGRREMGPSANWINLLGPLHAAGVPHLPWFPDVEIESRPGCDPWPGLVDKIHELGANKLLITFEGWGRDIPPDTLRRLRDSGVKVGMVWWDMSSQFAGVPIDAVDFHLIHHPVHLRYVEEPMKCLLHWYAHDPTIFNPKRDGERDIDLLFSGTFRDQERVDGIARILEAFPDREVVIRDSGKSRLTFRGMADLMRRAKIVINWPGGRNGYTGGITDQHKGRCFEAMRCGAVLLERENFETAQWVRPGIDYATSTTETMVEEITWLLDDEGARRRIASSGLHAMQGFNVGAWWRPIEWRLSQ